MIYEMFDLPQELQDMIMLKLDMDTLKRTRELQSEYVKESTRSMSLYLAEAYMNKRNVRWLKERG